MEGTNDVVDFNFKKFPARVYRDFKAHCATKGVSMKSELEDAMKERIKKGGKDGSD